MSQQQIIDISNANKAIGTIEKLNLVFLDHCEMHATSKEFSTALKLADNMISIDAFGNLANAKGRRVRSPSGEFFFEYIFRVAVEECGVEIWRFYLTSNGLIVRDLETQSNVCDYNNIYIAKHLCGNVLAGVLQSNIFSPTPRSDR